MPASNNKEIIKEVNELLIKGDIEGFLSNCADSIVWKMIGEPEMAGKETVRNAMTHMGQEPPVIEIERMIEENGCVMVEGFFEMKEPSGKIMASPFCDIYTMKDDKIVELHSYFNTNPANNNS